MEARLGTAAGQAGGGPLALNRPPDEEQVTAALEELRKPTDRFFAELFWFWPSADRDEALLALEQGRTDDALNMWSAEPPAGRRVAARHNLAIFYHMLALDDEIRVANGTADSQQAARLRLQTSWPRALRHWCDVHADPDFQVAVAERAAALNDVRVSQELVRDVLRALPSGVLRINAQMAFAAAERSDLAATGRHRRLLTGSAFEPAARIDAIRGALEPWEQRIRQAIESAKANWSRTPQRANQHVRTMHASCKRLLSIADAVLSDGKDGSKTSGAESYGALRDALYDMVADAMLDGQLVFNQKNDDWNEAVKLIELALELAAGDALRSRLTKELGTVRSNAEDSINWCAPGYWDLPEATVAILEDARERTRVGDLDGALAKLVPLDVSIGRPLRCAAAFCLSVSAIEIASTAWGEFNKEPETRRRLFDKVAQNPSLLYRRPNPSMPSYTNPPCPLCNRSYERWYTFEVNQMPMWLCENCWNRLRREVDDQRAALRREIYSALQKMLLADEVDPGQPSIAKGLQTLRGQASDLKCSIPSTAALRARLDPDDKRETKIPHDLPRDSGDTVCHFCRKNAPSPGCDISVPVCGDKQTVPRLLGGRSISFKVATVSIPRCQGCRDAHNRQRRWQTDRENAANTVETGVKGWLQEHPFMIGAAVCFVVGYIFRDARAGIGALSVVSGLLAGGVATAWLTRLASLTRAMNLKVFLAKHPEPKLPAGIEPESSYVNFPKLKDLRRRQWSFGHVYRPEQNEPVDVKGLALAKT